MRLFAIVAVAATLAAAPAIAKDKKPVDPNKKICRGETPTGSMMSKSTCHTAAEWQAIDNMNSSNAELFSQQRSRTAQQH